MSDEMIVKGFAFLATMIAVLVPLFRLNGNIVKLTTVVEQLEKLVKDKTDKLDARVTEHGKEIDQLKIDVAEHEVKLKALEK